MNDRTLGNPARHDGSQMNVADGEELRVTVWHVVADAKLSNIANLCKIGKFPVHE